MRLMPERSRPVLSVGQILSPLEEKIEHDTVTGSRKPWYRVDLGNGKLGWVDARFTVPYDSAKKADVYRHNVRDRLNFDKGTFADWVNLYDFIQRALPEVRASRDVAGELALASIRT